MSVVKATYKKDYVLSLQFSDGLTVDIDFELILKAHSIYKPYLKREKFQKFKIDHGALRWPGNVLDFHSSQLRKMPALDKVAG